MLTIDLKELQLNIIVCGKSILFYPALWSSLYCLTGFFFPISPLIQETTNFQLMMMRTNDNDWFGSLVFHLLNSDKIMIHLNKSYPSNLHSVVSKENKVESFDNNLKVVWKSCSE
jgi:hypothetical protein